MTWQDNVSNKVINTKELKEYISSFNTLTEETKSKLSDFIDSASYHGNTWQPLRTSIIPIPHNEDILLWNGTTWNRGIYFKEDTKFTDKFYTHGKSEVIYHPGFYVYGDSAFDLIAVPSEDTLAWMQIVPPIE